MAWTLHTYTDTGQLADVVGASLQDACRNALATRGMAMLALAGGQTPWPVYRRLASTDLRWPGVTVLPTDDRCVPTDASASNLSGLRDAFASADGVRFAALTVADGEPEASLVHARDWLAAHPEPFDAVLLGMGTDGHTASLFPGATELANGFDPELDVCRVDPDPLPPEAPYPRISLTVARLLHAGALHLVLIGEDKRTALMEAIAIDDPWRHPIMAVLSAPEAHVDIHWSP